MTVLSRIIEELPMVIRIYLSIIALITAVGFFLMGFDKYRAIKKQYRIPESTLMSVAFLGGAIGILLGMLVFRHKINKVKFSFGVPLLVLINLGIHLYIFHQWL